MALSIQPYKGARDFYPEDKRRHKYIFGVMRRVVERFGYEEYDAPILEPLEIYAAKSGDEIVNEQTYSFTDRGERKVVIRPEMTPSVSRMVAARRQELAYPLRWYSIPNLWRYERPQRGRLREHWQLNVDLFGVADLSAEHEMIMLADEIMREFGAKRSAYTIRISSRKLIDAFLVESLGLNPTQSQTMRSLIDRLHKTGQAEFRAQADLVFSPSQREAGAATKLSEFLAAGNIEELPDKLSTNDAATQLNQLLKLFDSSTMTNLKFDPSLMRGFDYYTDIVFEVFDNNPENNRSMFGGGRYDGLVGLFGVEPVPTIGFGMGDVTLANFLDSNKLFPPLKPETDLYVVLIGDVYDRALAPITQLRGMGLNVALDNTGRKADKQIKSASKKNIAYVLFLGEHELKEEQYMLKNLQTGKEERHGLERIVSIVKDHRNKA